MAKRWRIEVYLVLKAMSWCLVLNYQKWVRVEVIRDELNRTKSLNFLSFLINIALYAVNLIFLKQLIFMMRPNPAVNQERHSIQTCNTCSFGNWNWIRLSIKMQQIKCLAHIKVVDFSFVSLNIFGDQPGFQDANVIVRSLQYGRLDNIASCYYRFYVSE